MSKISLNEKLDQCAELLVSTYNEILIVRDSLSEQLDNGFINMSKARSLLGCSGLSAMQIPAELESKITVEVVEHNQRTVSGFEYKDLEFNLDINNYNKNSEEQMEAKYAPLPSWFGALPPMSLKNSHMSFSSSIHTIKSLCELQTKLHYLQIAYKQLLAEKDRFF